MRIRQTTFATLASVAFHCVLPAQETYEDKHLKAAIELHSQAIVIDSHSDVTPRFHDDAFDFSKRGSEGHMDIPRLRDGGFGAEFLSIYMGRRDAPGAAIKEALYRIDAAHQTVARHPRHLELAYTAADVRRIHATGRIACLMGIEGGHIIEDSLFALRMFHRLGCRYMTLTHSFNTNWADAAGVDDDAPGQHGGLTEFGREIVREMNRLGMMVDISHVADSTFFAALETTTAPPIASHSSARALHPHRRNLSDEMLRAVAERDGVVMINFYCGFIDPTYDERYKAWEERHRGELGELAAKFKANLSALREARAEFARHNHPPRSTLLQLALHVEHVAKVAGWQHVGIGADWDGVRSLPEGIDHCGHLPRLTALLLARGATPEQLRLFLGENLLRVMTGCERRAEELRR